MSVESWAAVVMAGVTLFGAVTGAVAWVRNSMSALRREVDGKIAAKLEEASAQVRAVEKRLLARIEQERANADRIYASQTAVAEMAQQIRSMTELLADVRREVHEVWTEMRKNGRRSYTPNGA